MLNDIWARAPLPGEPWNKDGANYVIRRLKKRLPRKLHAYLEQDFLEKTKAPDYLHRPLCTVSLGHTDNLAIVLADEFSYAHWPLEYPRLPVRQSSVAVCPDIASINDGEPLSDIFCDMREVFSDFGDPDDYGVRQCEFTKSRPLVAVTYYRTTGLANFGSGMLFQEAMIRGMRNSIQGTRDRMKCDKKLVTEDDTASLKCAFLVPVGWADLVTVMFASNYSVMFSALNEVRQMRVQDLYDAMASLYDQDNALKEVVAQFGIHRRLAEIENKYRCRQSFTYQGG